MLMLNVLFSLVNVEGWIAHPNVSGVIWSGMPASEYGPVIVDILFGDFNPGGINLYLH
jgi:beta-glucosidase